MTALSDKVSELAEKVGSQDGSFKGLTRLFDRHCDDDDRRHSENVAALGRVHEDNIQNFREVFAELREINAKLGPVSDLKADVIDIKRQLLPVAGLVTDVAEIKPHIESYKTFRIQVSLLVVAVTSAVTGTMGLMYLALTHFGEIREALGKFLSVK